MIEQAFFFAIGFLVALLAAIVATPLVFRRALRLVATRARTQAPMTEERVAADRDVIFAAHAVERTRLEHRVAVAEEEVAALRAMSGRHSVQIITLQSDAAERESFIFDMRSELERRAAERNNLIAAQAANRIALHEALVERDRAQNLLATAAARVEELKAEASRARAKIAISVARAEHLEELLSSAEAARAKADRTITELTNSLAVRNRKVGELDDLLRKTIGDEQDLTARLQRAKVAGEEAAKHVAELEARLRRSEQMREEMLIEKARQLAALAELRVARVKTAESEARLSAFADKSAQSAIVAHAAGTKGSILAAPVELEMLRRKSDDVRARLLTPASAQDAPGNAALRASIKNFGQEVRSLFAEQAAVESEGVGLTERAPLRAR